MPTAAYDRIADWYDERVRTGWGHPENAEREFSVLSELIGDIEGKGVCDLACGQGANARWLARNGARVVGVDISDRLLKIAMREEEDQPLGIVYMSDDAQRLAKLPDRSFDGVVCVLALMDIADVDACFRAVARVLRSGGWFVFTITHPCFLMPGARRVDEYWQVGEYFDQGFQRPSAFDPEGVRGKVGAYHRTLGTYVNGLVEAGLTIEKLIEPQELSRVNVRMPNTNNVPPFLLARCRKL